MADVWDHLRDETGVEVALTGRPPKVSELSFRFQGTVADFNRWASETFKDPEKLNIIVTSWSESAPLTAKPLPTITPSDKYHTAYQKLVSLYPSEGDKILAAFPELLGHVRNHQKIEAIKLVRSVTQSGLKEAKDYVEEWLWGRDF